MDLSSIIERGRGSLPAGRTEQLHAYRSGRRQNNVMQGFAAGLSDDDIRRLADHYGSR